MDVFGDVSKIVFRGRRNTLAPFSDDMLHFSWQALWTCPAPFCVTGTALQTWRVACFLQMALPGLREVVTKCKFRGRRGILCDVMKFGGSLARTIDFEVANFVVLRKFAGKRRFST